MGLTESIKKCGAVNFEALLNCLAAVLVDNAIIIQGLVNLRDHSGQEVSVCLSALALTGPQRKYSQAYPVIQGPLLANFRLLRATAATSASTAQPSSWHTTKER